MSRSGAKRSMHEDSRTEVVVCQWRMGTDAEDMEVVEIEFMRGMCWVNITDSVINEVRKRSCSELIIG